VPTAPRRPCLEPRCPELVTRGGRCPAHARTHERASRGESVTWRGWYKTARWHRLRAFVLAADPLCRSCKAAGRVEPATDVDHVVPHKGDSTRFWDVGNLTGLCKSCHSRKTQAGL
jgi:5-methylcytosine-specific restriction enzyme A